MNIHSKSWNIAGASPSTSSQSMQYAVLLPIKAILNGHSYTALLSSYRIQTAMKYALGLITMLMLIL